MKNNYYNKLNCLEENYRKEQQKLEEDLLSVFHKKQNFWKELEELSENYRYQYEQANFDVPINMGQVYYQIERCQEEANDLINQAMKELEEKKLESSQLFRVDNQKLEEEFASFIEEKRG